MIMDLMPGRPLHLLKEEKANFDAQSAFLNLLEIVGYLHAEKVVHNDLKLENVLLSENGKVSLVDFGNARLAEKKGLFGKLFAKREPTFGTPTYLAPELIAGEGEPSFRSDCYSLAVCCFVLLTGDPPFTYDRKSARLRAAVNQAPPSLASRRTGLSSSFVRLIDSCLAKNPEQRPEDAQRLFSACRLIQKAGGTAAIKSIDL
jgi:serine/threonine protein kinase